MVCSSQNQLPAAFQHALACMQTHKLILLRTWGSFRWEPLRLHALITSTCCLTVLWRHLWSLRDKRHLREELLILPSVWLVSSFSKRCMALFVKLEDHAFMRQTLTENLVIQLSLPWLAFCHLPSKAISSLVLLIPPFKIAILSAVLSRLSPCCLSKSLYNSSLWKSHTQVWITIITISYWAYDLSSICLMISVCYFFLNVCMTGIKLRVG